MAGQFGSRECDTPIRLAKRMLLHARDALDEFDFILVTGDNSRHDRDPKFAKTPRETMAENRLVRSALSKYFPTKPIVFTIGNNDLYVHDQLGFGDGVLDLRKHFMVWRHYIPRDQWRTFIRGGYYAISGYDTPLDIIAMNTQYFTKSNVIVDDCSVKGSPGRIQLKWMKAQLEICKQKGSFAYLVGHIAPSSEYHPECLKRFKRITRKYSQVIHSQFYGHSNYDEFFLTRDVGNDSSRRTRRGKDSVGLVAPSVVPLFNPAIRIVQYDLELETFGRILNYWQFYVDLDEANMGVGTRLRLEYEAQQVYGPGPFTSDYYRRLQKRISVESSLKEKYELFRVVSCVSCLDALR